MKWMDAAEQFVKNQSVGENVRAVIEGLTVALGEFQIGSHADDTAALVLRRRGPRNPERDEQDASEAENLAVTE